LSSWVAYKLSWRAVSPILDIARDIRKLDLDNFTLGVPSKNLSGETKELAEALDEYTKRIDVFVDRERQFTADISHELRTPMTIIDGAAQFLEAESLTEKSLKRVKMIRRACRDVNDLTTAFFLLARESSLDEKRYKTNVSAIIQEQVIKYNSLIDSSKIEVIVHMISDTGIGIPEDLLPELFKRHVRGRGLNKAGEGIGLAIVKRLCDQFDWSISIKNNTNHGVLVSLEKL